MSIKGTIKRAIASIRKEEKANPADKSWPDLRGKMERLAEIAKKDVKTDEDIKMALSITCFGDLAYCCKSGARDCPRRDAILEAIGKDYEWYEHYKAGCSRLFWNALKAEGMGG